MSNSSNSSTIVLTLKDEVSSCTFAVIDGVVHQIISGGIPAADVLRNAVLTCTAEQMASECTRVFNSSNDEEYVATIEPTRRATIYEAGNGLPGFADTVLADEEIWQIVTPDSDLRISTNGPGQGNSIEATLVAVGNQCDLTDDQWDAAHDGRVVLH
jgi:hypothetical protein